MARGRVITKWKLSHGGNELVVQSRARHAAGCVRAGQRDDATHEGKAEP